MRKTLSYSITDEVFLQKALQWASTYEVACLLNSNGFQNDTFSKSHIACVLAVGAQKEINPSENYFEQLQRIHDTEKDWLFGFLSYDLKNELEGLVSENPDNVGFPVMHFFIPQYLLEFNGDKLLIHYHTQAATVKEAEEVINNINAQELVVTEKLSADFIPQIEKPVYSEIIKQIKHHIQKGEIYEMCYCMEFYAENIRLSPFALYFTLNEVSPTPFSCFYKWKDKYLLSASPERFLKKEGNKVFSQPIKGTSSRDIDAEKDLSNKEKLLDNIKEKAENVMIVDLVRNDLSVNAVPGTVRVEELFGVYSFPQVHQMISTISCEVSIDINFTNIIKPIFPMGSMTGAPKIKAMKLAEQYENTKRGLYSGAVGYIKPNGDFDFNVVIRSLQYNASNQYLSFMVGSAITANSEIEQEYNECLLKAQAMLNAVDAYGE